LLFYEGLPQATCPPKSRLGDAGGSDPQVKRSLSEALLERSDHLEMAQDRLEECLQAVVTGTHPRTIERGGRLLKSIFFKELTIKDVSLRKNIDKVK
jgi:hypothetical protein